MILLALAFVGALLNMIENSEKVTRLDLQALARRNGYTYAYTPSRLPMSRTSVDSSLNIASDSAGNSVDTIDINNCGYYDFEALPGIGPALADAIIAYRDSVGKFDSIQNLMDVRGIGPAKFSAIRNRVAVK